MKAIDKINKKIKTSIETNIVLASGSPIIEEVKLFIKNSINFKLFIDVTDMSKIYNNSTIAIGAPGLSHLERLYLGLPTILIAQNNIHELLVDQWVKLNCALKSKNTVTSIEKTIFYIMKNNKIRNDLMRNGRKQVDGKGSIRIAKSILKYNKRYD
jgi:spore coat polysaccharide biosynthesis predicted glycosyltransferase SpsG